MFEVSKLLFVIMNHQRKKMTKCRSASLSLNVTHKCSNLPDNHDYSLFFFLFESGDKIIKVKFSDNHLGSTVWCWFGRDYQQSFQPASIVISHTVSSNRQSQQKCKTYLKKISTKWSNKFNVQHPFLLNFVFSIFQGKSGKGHKDPSRIYNLTLELE